MPTCIQKPMGKVASQQKLVSDSRRFLACLWFLKAKNIWVCFVKKISKRGAFLELSSQSIHVKGTHSEARIGRHAPIEVREWKMFWLVSRDRMLVRFCRQIDLGVFNLVSGQVYDGGRRTLVEDSSPAALHD